MFRPIIIGMKYDTPLTKFLIQIEIDMKIYIAGKISGLPKAEYTAKFLQAELALRAAGLEPVNPCNFGIPDPTSCALAFCPSSINNDIMKTNVNIPITA